MRVALISDQHGNAIAFDAVIADLEAQHVDRVVCLGDVAQGGPQPAECLERLRELDCPCVRGNSDDLLLTLDPTPEEGEDEERMERLLEGARWTVGRLSDEQLEFIRSFEPTVELEVGGGRRLLCFHGSPRSNNEVILPDTSREDFEAAVGVAQADLLAGGHVHLQWLRRHGDGHWLCAGSVGLAYDPDQKEESLRADPWGEYAILVADERGFGVEFRRVPFDVDRVVKAIRRSEQPNADRALTLWSGR